MGALVVLDFIDEEAFWQMVVQMLSLQLAYALLAVGVEENADENDGLRVCSPSYILFIFLKRVRPIARTCFLK